MTHLRFLWEGKWINWDQDRPTWILKLFHLTNSFSRLARMGLEPMKCTHIPRAADGTVGDAVEQAKGKHFLRFLSRPGTALDARQTRVKRQMSALPVSWGVLNLVSSTWVIRRGTPDSASSHTSKTCVPTDVKSSH